MIRPSLSRLTAIALSIALCAGAALAYTPPSPPPPNKNIYELIVLNKKLGKFADMVEESGLKDTLSANTGEPMTVFAPTDDALDDIPHDVLRRIEASKASLQNFVKYHIIAGSAVASGSIRGRRLSLASANGEELSFDGSDRAKPPKVGDGALEQMDIGATNGILHTVSNALVPPSLAQAPLPPPAAPKQPQAPQAPAAATAPSVPVPVPTAQSGITATTTGAKASAALAPLRITTSGVAQSPVTVSTTGIGSSAASITTSGVATAPSAAAATTSSAGFELFGHKFSW
jgi:uncharacterized surface protein with fasciclin (FAS1) repeats